MSAAALRTIAFYLPQFHPIPENDAWWGEGYTEWTRVAAAKPLFFHHHQPQIPANLGFYDLRVPEVRAAQARLAKRFGIYGFCYHHYWFSGRRLLERPLAEVLASGKPDLPFCICWANENWTRRWDGRDEEVLVTQTHRPEDDVAFLRDLLPLLKDPRYIRVNGKPMIVVYRTRLLPDPQRSAAVWRKTAKAAGLPGLYLARVESFDDPTPPPNPETLGFDAAVEFPPHGIDLPEDRSRLSGLDPDFAGRVYDYGALADAFLARPKVAYRRHRGVMVGWDNTPRVGRRAHIAHDATPEVYRRWLAQAADLVRSETTGETQLIFINAWNEWGEGCHLEPDQRFGLGWLDATASALGVESDPSPPLTPPSDIADLRDALLAARARRDALETALASALADVERLGAERHRLELAFTQAQADARNLAKLAEEERASRDHYLESWRLAQFQLDRALEQSQDLERQGAEIDDLRQEMASKLAMRDATVALLTARVHAVYNSTSWKVSAPLRKLAPLARRLRYLLARVRGHGHALRIAPLPSEATPVLNFISAQDEADDVASGFSAPPLPSLSDGQPLVSIIVPMFNHIDHTILCLASFDRNKPPFPFEVIVVDDCSTELAELGLKPRPWLRVVRNAVNLGFIGACNRGAMEARGVYFHFLNNDTEIAPRAVEELVYTLLQNPDIGLVGSKLIYPDGRLQEAGGIIWNDGSGWNWGRGHDPKLAPYSYLRPVDYVSGASILLAADLYRDIGGFDSYYEPAYYEDTDLAFKVRNVGLKVAVQPLSRVIHHEGVSSGTDLTQGVKAHQVTNQIKFHARWARVLAHHGEPGVAPDLAKDRYAVGRVLFVDATTPTPDQDAGSLAAMEFMRALIRMNYKVSFVPQDNMAFIPGYTAALRRIGVEVLIHPEYPTFDEVLRCHGGTFDLIVIHRYVIAERILAKVRAACPTTPVAFINADLNYLREGRQAAIEGSVELAAKAAETKAGELAILRAVDLVVVHSDVEREILKGEGITASIRLFHWPMPIAAKTPGPQDRRDLVFIGGYSHPPNVDAVNWMAREVMPIIWAEAPDVTFHMIGSNMPDDVKALVEPRIVARGFLSDLTSTLESARLMVAPLRYGAGFKGKVTQAMAAGLPQVITSIAAEGIDLTDGQEVLIADDPKSFAKACLRLLSDDKLWRDLSANSLMTMKRRFSVENATGQVATILADLAVPPFIGHCDFCGGLSRFDPRGTGNLRESMTCSVCGATARQRAMAAGLIEALGLEAKSIGDVSKRAADKRILDTDPMGPIARYLKGHPFYTSTIYLPDRPFGEEVESGLWNADLANLPFEDQAFDAILTSDVMEHVRHPEAAHREIWRCLRPGGAYVFTVLYVPGWTTRQTLVEVDGDRDIMVAPPQYHGCPIRPDQGILVYRIYGRDLIQELTDLGFRVEVRCCPSRAKGQTSMDLWVAHKPTLTPA